MEKNENNDWAVFDVKNKSDDSKIIGCITPYKWYKIDENGYPIKNGIEKEVWRYFTAKITTFQREYNFDFLRADMAHNQISHSHNTSIKDEANSKELWAVVKNNINEQKPYFALLAEAFYNTYYIDGIADMLNKKVDIVLGNMNFKFLNNEFVNWIDDFLNPFRKNFSFHPCVCVFLNDGDLPQHNQYFCSQEANEVRYFISMFLNLPSYMGIGFETKSLNPNRNKICFSLNRNQLNAKLIYTNSIYDEITKNIKDDFVVENIFVGEFAIYEFEA